MKIEALNLLILEDNHDDADLAVKQLEREGLTVKWTRVQTEKTFQKGLEENPDLILADYIVPSFGGIDALKIKGKVAPDIPLIMVSGKIGEEVAVECMKFGAADYVLKDKLFRLGTVVKRALEEAEVYRARREAEEALHESEERYRSLYESSKDGIGFYDMQGNFLNANRALLDMVGYTEEEIKKLSYQQLTPKKWHDMEADIVKDQIVIRGYSDEYEKELIAKDGRVFPATIRVWLIEDKQGRPTGMWAMVRDITDRKKTEDKLKHYQEHLEKLVEERTAKLKGTLKDLKKEVRET